MKILSLRFTNLNSLQGSWEIDFTHPSFASEGIFAITGRTGSGKSTILDAMCLALFGQTPRLKSITASSNDIMSRHTGECMAEVDFRTYKGDFRATWYQNRARKKVDGALQPPKHTLAELESETFLTEKTTDTVRAVEEATGLNFTRFTRSVLLAQGSFAAFLQARDDERSDVLEQLTGTEIYSDISVAVFQQAKDEREKLGRLRESAEDLRLLTPEELATLNNLLADEEKKRASLNQERERLENALNWFTAIAQLEQELRTIGGKKKTHEQEEVAFAPSRQSLHLAQRALELDAPYAVLKNQRAQKDEVEKRVVANKHSLAEHEKSLEHLSRQRLEAETARATLRREHQAERLTHIKVRELDIQLEELLKNQRKAREVLDKYQKDAREASEKADARRTEVVHASVNALRIFCQRLVRASHEQLAEGYWPLESLGQQLVEVIREQERVQLAQQEIVDKIEASGQEYAAAQEAMKAGEANLIVEQQTLASLEKEREMLLQGKEVGAVRTSYDEAQEHLEKLQHSLDMAERVVDVARELAMCDAGIAENQDLMDKAGKEIECLKVAIGGWQTELDGFEKASLEMALSEHREYLVHGQPCPLCGALEHPYVREFSPSDAVTSGIDVGESETGQVDESQIDFSGVVAALKEKIAGSETRILHSQAQQAEARGRVAALSERRKEYGNRLATNSAALHEKTLAFGIVWEIPDEGLLKAVQGAYNVWNTKRDALRTNLHALERLGQAIEKSNTGIRTARENYDVHAAVMQQAAGVMEGYKKSLGDLALQNKQLRETLAEKIHKWQKLVLPLTDRAAEADSRTGRGMSTGPGKETTGNNIPAVSTIPDIRAVPTVIHAIGGIQEACLEAMPDVPRSLVHDVEAAMAAWLEYHESRMRDALLQNVPVPVLSPDCITAEQVQDALKTLFGLRKRWLELDDEYALNRQLLEKLLPLWGEADEAALKMQATAKEQELAYTSVVAERERVAEERKNIFEDKDVDAEEARLRQAEEAAETALTMAISAEKATQGSLDALREQEQELAGMLIGATEKAVQGEAHFLDLLAAHDFSDETEFMCACLDAPARKVLEERARVLDEYRAELEAQEREKRLLLTEKQEQPPVDQPEEEIRRDFATLLENIQKCNESIGGLREKVDNNARLEAEKQGRLEEIAAQQRELGKWETLNELIGSSEGKKFRRFAQGLTFEAVASEANKVLARLSDRYTLLCDTDNPLELNVCDSDQAGEIRSTRNLSGGESFIVSLALALGLSSMASRTVRLDSLFLDEGFGALDEDTLDVALDVLASLPDDGKVIGIISHVSSLKERIRKSIQVVPMAGGRSRLEEGEGVRRL